MLSGASLVESDGDHVETQIAAWKEQANGNGVVSALVAIRVLLLGDRMVLPAITQQIDGSWIPRKLGNGKISAPRENAQIATVVIGAMS